MGMQELRHNHLCSSAHVPGLQNYDCRLMAERGSMA